MARAGNFYYAGDSKLGSELGATLGRALFGDPEAAANLALRKAQMGQYDAQAAEANAHAGLYGAQTEGVGIQNDASKGLPALIRSMFPTAAPAAPAAPADPLAALPDPNAQPTGATAVTFDPQTFRNGLPALLGAMAQMQGDKVDPNKVVGDLAAMTGNDEFARRGMIGMGQTPDKDFALTSDRADTIASQGYNARYLTDTAVAGINHASDIPIAKIESGDRRRGQDIESGDRRYKTNLGNTVGFGLVTDVLPGARMTSGERSPEHNAAVGGAPRSYHLPGDGVEAYDIQPGTGARNFQDAKAAMEARYGNRLVEGIDETARPGYGPHWHFAIADVPISKGAKAPKQVSAASSKMVSAELDKQLAAAGLNAQGTARANMLASALSNYQSTGNPALAVERVLNYYNNRVAAADKPPVAGAQKAPDGNWYVKQGNGYARVEVTG